MPLSRSKLVSSTIWIMLLALASAFLAAQWKQETMPVLALVVVLVLTVLKARLVILDFMHLRGHRPRLAAALLCWPAFFAIVILVKVLMAGLIAA
ncbi:cytochrome C oxidase subunit IV family protein [Phyllobacterium phragmitis]|uniref:Cytochrome C oxidase subunit IV n=1 Tax=Phyllobacterium phragmitis TaxID=2670329 RepID=A0ABQ0H2B5_9HYPH